MMCIKINSHETGIISHVQELCKDNKIRHSYNNEGFSNISRDTKRLIAEWMTKKC